MHADEIMGEDWVRGLGNNKTQKNLPEVLPNGDGLNDEFVERMKQAEHRLSGNPMTGDDLMDQIRKAMGRD